MEKQLVQQLFDLKRTVNLLNFKIISSKIPELAKSKLLKYEKIQQKWDKSKSNVSLLAANVEPRLIFTVSSTYTVDYTWLEMQEAHLWIQLQLAPSSRFSTKLHS